MPFNIDPSLIENDEVRLTEDGNGDLAIEHVPSGRTVTVDEDISVSDIAKQTLDADLDANANNITNVGSLDTEEVSNNVGEDEFDYVVYQDGADDLSAKAVDTGKVEFTGTRQNADAILTSILSNTSGVSILLKGTDDLYLDTPVKLNDHGESYRISCGRLRSPRLRPNSAISALFEIGDADNKPNSVEFENIWMDLYKSNFTGTTHGLHFKRASNIYADKCYLKDGTGDAYRFEPVTTDDIKDIKLQRVKCEGFDGVGYHIMEGADRIVRFYADKFYSFSNGTAILVDGRAVEDVTISSATLTGDTGVVVRGADQVKVANSKILSAGNAVLIEDDDGGLHSRNLSFSNCDIDGDVRLRNQTRPNFVGGSLSNGSFLAENTGALEYYEVDNVHGWTNERAAEGYETYDQEEIDPGLDDDLNHAIANVWNRNNYIAGATIVDASTLRLHLGEVAKDGSGITDVTSSSPWNINLHVYGKTHPSKFGSI